MQGYSKVTIEDQLRAEIRILKEQHSEELTELVDYQNVTMCEVLARLDRLRSAAIRVLEFKVDGSRRGYIRDTDASRDAIASLSRAVE